MTVLRIDRWRDFDWPLLLAATLLASIGLVEIYSATMSLESDNYFSRQLVWVSVGITLALIIGIIDYHFVSEQIPWIYAASLLLLVYTMVFGRVVNGARSWVFFGPVGFQPSELVKIVVVVALARYFSELRTRRPYLGAMDIVRAVVICGIPMALVLAQPDLGTALTYVPVLAFGLLIRGLRPAIFVVAAIGIALLLPTSWLFLKDYQKDRILTFLDPERDPLGTGYQVLQSKIAVGSGGFWGKGLFRGSQNQLGFLPTRQTDFIFSVIAEELGFIGVLAALGLLSFVVFRAVSNAQTSRDSLGLFIAMGVAGIFSFHTIINVAMVIGFVPITGIPLPFLSYGGSSLIMAFIGLGLIINVRRQRYVN